MVAVVTVTVKLQEAELPALSVAVYVTTVDPTGKDEPDGKLLLTTGTPALSVAVGGVQVIMAKEVPELVVAEMSDGQLARTGGVTSTGADSVGRIRRRNSSNANLKY